jgi:tRNA A-37 threonylcarbamoyl transferase component Bud32/tetratricopeptide (TPR) repeat protein
LSANLRDQLQTTLSGTHTLERELGGGGMSKVFVAEEVRLKRKVVVKVLSPELAQGISVERFEREIQTVAALQQANIVPVISAGDTNGLPYYTMPFVEGESLRARLARGPLAVTEVIGVLRDVTRALAYAHQRGVVHRDIKPDNVLMSGGAAVVTDFGIAKAISAARTASGNATLTQIGTSIGTPAYMAPEQAAGDPQIDHRADIYSLGAMAYELLSGQAVFANRTPQRMLAAHMSEAPKSITEFRGDLPPALADIVMQCLAKESDKRPQQAGDIARVLDTITSGSGMQSMPPVLLGGPAMLGKALAIYAAAFVAVAILAKAAIVGIGLPNWVFPGSMIVMALGLPVILWTGYVQRVARRAITMTPTFTPGGTPSTTAHGTIATMALKAAPRMSWYRTAKGGVYAFGTFIAIIAVFMIMRQFGIGPAGSLFGSGMLAVNERLLVAEFDVKGGADTSLGTVAAEAIRMDLGQSRVVNVVPASLVRASLQRMRRPVSTRLDRTVASEIALREAIKAVVHGDVTPIGSGFILTARLIAPESGDELASFRATADGPTDLIPAVERLSRAMRGKIGESLRTVQASADLADVTTGSLDALRKYAEGVRAVDVERDAPRGVALLKEAIALDTAFAMAWRKLAVAYNIGRLGVALEDSASERAYRFRDRLPDMERFSVIGLYYGWGRGRDRAKAAQAFEALNAISPTGYHNLAVQYVSRRQYARAETLYKKNLARNPILQSHEQLIGSLAAQRKWAEAESLAIATPRLFPGAAGVERNLIPFVYQRGQLDSVDALVKGLRSSADPQVQVEGALYEATVGMIRGRLQASERAGIAARRVQASRGVLTNPLVDSVWAANNDAWFRDAGAQGARRLEASLARTPMRTLPEPERPYFAVATVFARSGQPVKARAVLAEFSAEVRDTALRRWSQPFLQRAQGEIALAERRPLDALADFRKSDSLPDGPAGACEACVYALLARAFDQANQPDSAIYAFEQFLLRPGNRLDLNNQHDGMYLAGTYKRLGELYEQKGDRAKALEYYQKFVDLWKDADAELQPKVAAVREKMKKLSPVEGKKP